MAEQIRQQSESRNSVRNTITVALLVSLFCSVMVSGTAVLLKSRQVENRLYYGGQQTVIQLLESLPLNQSMESALGNLTIRIVELATGDYAENFDPLTFDQEALAQDPEQSEQIPEEIDVAGLRRREKFAMVYLLMNAGELEYLILPIYGQGMWSPVHAYLALESDLNTVGGLIIRGHGETPGLGDRIENPEWLESWQGKQVYQQEQPVIRLATTAGSGDDRSQVDALTGATRSARAVVQAVQYWLDDHGYKNYLEKIREQSLNE